MSNKLRTIFDFGKFISYARMKPILMREMHSSLCQCGRATISTNQTQENLSRFATALTSRKLEYSERKLLKFPIEIIYGVVEDVDRYSEFVPWCKKSKVLVKTDSNQKALLEVGFGKITEKYNSTIACAKPHLVKAICTDGLLFNSLQCTWRFAPGKVKDTCIIDFQLTFEFRSLLYSQLAHMVFNEIVKTMVGAFEKRAHAIQSKARLKSKLTKHIPQ